MLKCIEISYSGQNKVCLWSPKVSVNRWTIDTNFDCIINHLTRLRIFYGTQIATLFLSKCCNKIWDHYILYISPQLTVNPTEVELVIEDIMLVGILRPVYWYIKLHVFAFTYHFMLIRGSAMTKFWFIYLKS